MMMQTPSTVTHFVFTRLSACMTKSDVRVCLIWAPFKLLQLPVLVVHCVSAMAVQRSLLFCIVALRFNFREGPGSGCRLCNAELLELDLSQEVSALLVGHAVTEQLSKSPYPLKPTSRAVARGATPLCSRPHVS